MNRVKRLIASIVVVVILLCSLSSCLPFFYHEKTLELELSGEVSMRYVYNQEFECYDVYLEGIAENATDKDMVSCGVSFTLYDNNGNVIGTADDYLNDLKSGAKWRFSATGSMGYEPASFELNELYGYENDN